MSGTVSPMRPAPGTTDEPQPDPVLIPGTDPVLLVRVQGTDETKSLPDMEAAAMAAGAAVKAAGAELIASQQEPQGEAPEAPPAP